MKIKNFIVIVFILVKFQTLYSNDYNEKKITLYDRTGIVNIAKQYLGYPYKPGGSSPSGFDCSGFVMYVYNKGGYKLPRTASDQFTVLRPVKVPKPGDLVFFKINNHSISHVGIYIGDFLFIHAPSSGKKVEIVDIRSEYWKKRYVGSRSYFLD